MSERVSVCLQDRFDAEVLQRRSEDMGKGVLQVPGVVCWSLLSVVGAAVYGCVY